ncbi:MAG: carboxypeptidase regulatory-like domain-containing protein [Planctomycetes bacterium]|nr:carboxypeptidase regulatory-like domain-containing protein [Planctomycetota bacterium]
MKNHLAAFFIFAPAFAVAFFAARALWPAAGDSGDGVEAGKPSRSPQRNPALAVAESAPINNINETARPPEPTIIQHAKKKYATVEEEIAAWPTCTITGIVLDYDGTPAGGARVERVAANGGPVSYSKEAKCGSDGRFRLSQPTWDPREIVLRVRHHGRFDKLIPNVRTEQNVTIDVGEVRLAAAGSVRVHIIDKSGRPVPNVEIQYKPEGAPAPSAAPPETRAEGVPRALRGMTDEEGNYTFEPVCAGRAALAAVVEFMNGQRAPQESLRISREIVNIEIAPGARESIEWTAASAGTLHGRATFRGKPVANVILTLDGRGARASWWPVRTRTDADGKYQFPPVPAGEYSIQKKDGALHFDIAARVAAADGAVSISENEISVVRDLNRPPLDDALHKTTILTGDNALDLDFGDASSAEVRVVDELGRPVMNAIVRIFRAPKPGTEFSQGYEARMQWPAKTTKVEFDRQAVSDAAGIVQFEAVPRGVLQLTTFKLEYARARGQFEIDADSDKSIKVQLRKGGALSGRVSDPNGAPIGGAIVKVLTGGADADPPSSGRGWWDMSPPAPTAMSDDAGGFVLNGLETGAHRILAFSNESGPEIMIITVPEAGDAGFLNITLESLGGFQVSVARRGEPATATAIRLRLDDPGCPIAADLWTDDTFFAMLGSGDFARAEGPADARAMTHIGRVPAGNWKIEVVDLPAGDKVLETVRARAIAGRDVPVFIELSK